MKNTLWSGVIAAALTAVPLAASAQIVEIEEELPPIVNVQAGLGAHGFLGQDLAGNTEPGGAWEVRATLMPDNPVAFEIGYLGGLNHVEVPGGGDLDAFVASNSGRAMVRANVLPLAGVEQDEDAKIHPYIAAGASYTNLDLVGNDRNDPAVESVFTEDANVFGIPAAVGVQALLNENFSLGARLAYNYMFDNQLVPADEDAQSWGATADLGVAF